MTTPEQRARQNIDKLLQAAGWVVQDRRDLNLGAGLGVAVREFPLSTGPADYLLFIERKAIGVVEAKPEGVTLSGVEAQSARYSIGLGATPLHWHSPLPFLYETTPHRRRGRAAAVGGAGGGGHGASRRTVAPVDIETGVCGAPRRGMNGGATIRPMAVNRRSPPFMPLHRRHHTVRV